MSSIEGIEQIGEAASRITIDEPPARNEGAEIMAAVAAAKADLPARPAPPEVTDETLDKAEDALFDDAAYVAVPEVDGQTADQIVIAFSGSVSYDAADEQGAKLYQDLKLGKAVELRVAGFVAGKAGGYKVTAREEEVVTGKATVRIDTLYLLTPESLG